MIPISNKFPLRTEFLSFRSHAKRVNTSYFQIMYLPFTPSEARKSEEGRLSVVVPKKVNKLATTRNWLKRLVYNHLWPLIINNNLDVVIVFKPFPLTKSLPTKEAILTQINKLEFY